MSENLNPMMISQELLALLVENNETDALTDILVGSLADALRILREEIEQGSLH